MTTKITNTTTQAMRDPASFLGEALLRGSSGAIEAQEARGQAEFVVSEAMPRELIPSVDAFEKLGFVFGADVADDPLFRQARLPAGWTRQRTDHSMWSEIVDEHGRARVAVFYKAAFYDRKAHAEVLSRFPMQEAEGSEDAWQIVDRALGAVAHVDTYDGCCGVRKNLVADVGDAPWPAPKGASK